MRDFKSLCKGPISETVQDSYIQYRTIQLKNRMSSSSGGSPVLSRDKGPCNINADKLAEFFVEKVEGVRAATSNVPPPSNVRHECISATSAKFPLIKCGSDDAFACHISALVRNSEGHRLKMGDNMELRTPVKNFWLRHCIRQLIGNRIHYTLQSIESCSPVTLSDPFN